MSTIEERVSILEKELAHIKQQLTIDKPQSPPHPWDKVFGSFANSEGFEEAVQLGREYRESLRPKDIKSLKTGLFDVRPPHPASLSKLD